MQKKSAISRIIVAVIIVVILIIAAVAAFEATQVGTTNSSSSVQSSTTNGSSLTSSLTNSLTSSSSFTAGSNSTPGGSAHTLVIGSTFDPLTLNPIYDTSNLPLVMPLIFDGITYMANNFTAEPLLATGWTISPNVSVYTFTIRQGVTFQDGVPLTAQDVAFTYQKFASPVVASEVQGQFANMTVTAPDNNTVVFKFPSARPDFITDTWYGIVPKHLLSNVSDTQLKTSSFSNKPVGSGPWEVVSYQPNTQISLTANPHYWRGVPKITNIIFKIVTDTSAMLADVESHQIDLLNTNSFAGGLTAQNIQQVGGNNSFQYVTQVPGTTQILYMGPQNEAPWNNTLVRQAVLYSINRSALIEKVLGAGGGVISNDRFVTPWAVNPNIPPYVFNITKANQLLDQAGYPKDSSGVRFSTTIYSTQGARVVWSQLIANMLSQVGIKATVDVVGDFGTYFTLLANQRTENGIWTIFNNIDADPATTAQEFLPSNTYPGGVNVINETDATLWQLLKQAGSTGNQSARQQLYYQAGLIISQKAYEWPLWITAGFNIVSCHVKNFTSDGAIGMDDINLAGAYWSQSC